MILLPHLEQGSPQWLAWRQTGLGCSDAPAIMGESPWKTPRQLWLEKTGQAALEDSTFAMRRGQRMEPIARQLYQDRTGRVVRPCCGRHEQYAWLLASLDGLDLWGALAVEIKAPNVDCHQQALDGQVPERYRPQVQHILLVSRAQRCDYVSYSEHRAYEGDERLAIVPVEPEPSYQELLLWRLWSFWGALQLRYWDGSLDAPARLPATPASVA